MRARARNVASTEEERCEHGRGTLRARRKSGASTEGERCEHGRGTLRARGIFEKESQHSQHCRLLLPHHSNRTDTSTRCPIELIVVFSYRVRLILVFSRAEAALPSDVDRPNYLEITTGRIAGTFGSYSVFFGKCRFLRKF